MKILILGAAGQISEMLIQRLVEETNHKLVLYARNASNRIQIIDAERETIIDGDFNNQEELKRAMQGVDLVYLNDMNSPEATGTIVAAMKENNVPIIIGATILGIYDEVIGEFGKWNARMVGTPGTDRHKKSAEIIESSGLSYTLLRLTWLYNQAENENYMISQKGEPFIGAQVSRQAVTRLVIDIIANRESFRDTSLGVSEPDTDWAKPSFY